MIDIYGGLVRTIVRRLFPFLWPLSILVVVAVAFLLFQALRAAGAPPVPTLLVPPVLVFFGFRYATRLFLWLSQKQGRLRLPEDE